uniref:Solute carrier family 7 member 14b n=1 Tax=Kryptolebias marmoratus TaxID=37003 RepID=A0A3Q3B318_KRYMA
MYSRLLRTKPVGAMAHGSDDLTELAEGSAVGLAKVLTTADLVSLGVGSCVGTGMYVVAGLVAKAMAGPGVILSFIIAAVASILSVCYAEFGVRVPKTTGSAYTYSYVTVGEFVAFFIGWNLILEYLIGTAAGASALSNMFDSLANHSISSYMITHLGTVRGLKGEDTYPDVLALFIALLVTVVIALGVKNSVKFNNVLNVVNLVVWVFMIIAGLFFLSASNWEGGNFLPYGWSGQVMQGAATCFYAFIGFDIIATTGEEAKNPNTSIPYAITASLVTCLTAYVSQVSVILTLMVPYDLIDGSAPLMEMFAVHGFLWGKYTVAVGSIAGLTVSLLGSLFPMPRVIYAMARDGLLFFLTHVSALTHTPAVACVVSGSFAAILALLVSLRDLIEMMSIGTLLAYTLVSVCVLLLRYQPDGQIDTYQFNSEDDMDNLKHQNEEPTKDDHVLMEGADHDRSYHGGGTEGEADDSEFHTGHAPLLKRLLGGHYYTLRVRLGMPDSSARPTPATGRIVTRCTLSFFFMSFFLWSTIIFGVEQGSGLGAAFSGLMATLMMGSLVKLLILIVQQPESPQRLPYMAPCVPFVPAAAILVNSYLMLKLSPLTWARFTIWCLILLIYGCYGVWHSTLELNTREQQAHASSYRRYDDNLDDTFSPDDLYPQDQDDGPYQGWSAPEERGHRYQNQNEDREDEQEQ